MGRKRKERARVSLDEIGACRGIGECGLEGLVLIAHGEYLGETPVFAAAFAMMVDSLLITLAIFVRALLFHHAMHLDQWRCHVARPTEMQFRLLSHGIWRAMSQVRKTRHPHTHIIRFVRVNSPSLRQTKEIQENTLRAGARTRGGHFGKRGEIKKIVDM